MLARARRRALLLLSGVALIALMGLGLGLAHAVPSREASRSASHTPRGASAAAAPSAPPTTTPACMTASPQALPAPADPVAAAFVSATQQTNGAQRQAAQSSETAATVAQQQDDDRAQVEALRTLRLQVAAIGFAPGMDADIGKFKWAIGQEQSAYIHAAGSSTPDSGSHLAQIDQSVQDAQTASNRLRNDLGLPPTGQCL